MAVSFNSVSVQSAGRAFADAWTWWLGELDRLVPDHLKDQVTRDAVEVRLELGARPFDVGVRNIATGQPFVASDLADALRRWGPLASATLSVPLGKCFVRDVVVPKSAASRSDDILRLDMERTTPFNRGNALAASYRPGPDLPGPNITVRQVILKRSFVAGFLDEVAAAGFPLKRIDVIDEGGRPLPLNLLPVAERRHAPATRWVRWLLTRGAVLLAVAWTAAFVLTLHDLDARLAIADVELKTATAEALANRQHMALAQTAATQLRQPRLRKVSGTSTIALWDEITRLLPDGTWLNDFRIEDGTVQMDGYSANASQLIPPLAQSPLLTNVTFASPVTRDSQRGVERFQIKAQIQSQVQGKVGPAFKGLAPASSAGNSPAAHGMEAK